MSDWRWAAVVAYCNAMSSAWLAARYPKSGGTYVYGRERLGDFQGYLAGWAFVVGKTASCAAMALTVGVYAWPGQANAVAVAAVVNYAGVQKSAWLRGCRATSDRAIVAVVLAVLAAVLAVLAVVLAVLAAVVVVSLGSEPADFGRLEVGPDASASGVLQAAGLLFFAFAGYARIATLGEEVRDPERTIPRAVPLAADLHVSRVDIPSPDTELLYRTRAPNVSGQCG